MSLPFVHQVANTGRLYSSSEHGKRLKRLTHCSHIEYCNSVWLWEIKFLKAKVFLVTAVSKYASIRHRILMCYITSCSCCRDTNNNVLDGHRSPQKVALLNGRHASLLDGGPKQNGLGSHVVDFPPCLTQPGQVQGIKLENHDHMTMLASHAVHGHSQDTIISHNDFNQCLADTHMLSTLTTSLVGL